MVGFDTQTSASEVKEEIDVSTASPGPSVKRHRSPSSPSLQSNKRVCVTQETQLNLSSATNDEALPVSNILHQGPKLVWADNRQGLCDALPYYKAHQSGAHTKDKIPIGILLAGGVEIGDGLHMNKVITNL